MGKMSDMEALVDLSVASFEENVMDKVMNFFSGSTQRALPDHPQCPNSGRLLE